MNMAVYVLSLQTIFQTSWHLVNHTCSDNAKKPLDHQKQRSRINCTPQAQARRVRLEFGGGANRSGVLSAKEHARPPGTAMCIGIRAQRCLVVGHPGGINKGGGPGS